MPNADRIVPALISTTFSNSSAVSTLDVVVMQVGHGQGVQGQGSLTQQQGALMHIMAALQQSTSESMGHQPDLDPIQVHFCPLP